MLIIILFKGAIKFQQKLNLIFIANFYFLQYWVDIYLIFTFYRVIHQHENNMLIKNNSGQMNASTQT